MTDRPFSIKEAARLVGLSQSRVRQLTDAGILTAATTAGGHRRYDETTLRREWAAYRGVTLGEPADRTSSMWDRTYRLLGLREDAVWADLREALEIEFGPLPSNARRILAYATTEMVNNAIDHSRGTIVTVDAAVDGRIALVRVVDDGVGAFANLATLVNGARPEDAVIEITKGKRTTAPDAHSGEGIFFTSKAVDTFELAANGYRVAFDNTIGDVALGESEVDGTTVAFTVDLDTGRSLVDVFDAYANGSAGFHRTTPRISLLSAEGEFISRSEAKRFAAGLEKFERVELDFTDVPLIGQGFADELFRVWQAEHPSIELIAIGANRGVRLMIDRVERGDL